MIYVCPECGTLLTDDLYAKLFPTEYAYMQESDDDDHRELWLYHAPCDLFHTVSEITHAK